MKYVLLSLLLAGCQATQAATPFPAATEANTAFPDAPAESRRAITAPTLLIREVTVIDGTGAPARTGQDLLIVNGKIAAYGPDLTAPAEAAVLEGAGMTVMPGLIDSHAHTQSVPGAMLRGDSRDAREKQQGLQLRAYLASGVTTLLDTGISPATLLRLRAIEQHGGPSPTIHHLSPFLTPDHGYFGTPEMRGDTYADMWPAVTDTAMIGPAIRAAAALAPVGVKVTVEDGMVWPVWPLFDAPAREVIRREASAAGTPVFVHSMTNDEHRVALEMKPYALVHVGMYDEDLDDDVVAGIKASGAYVISTLVTFPMEGWLWNPEPIRQSWIEARVPRVQFETALHPESLDRALDLMVPGNKPWWVPTWWARMVVPLFRDAESSKSDLASSMRAVRTLYEVGVPVVMGADAGNWPAFATFFHGVGSLYEMELLEQAGLPRGEVIVAATSRPARMLKQEHHIGTIAPGMDADLVIVAKNPLEHGMQALEDIRWVVKRGVAKTPASWLHD